MFKELFMESSKIVYGYEKMKALITGNEEETFIFQVPFELKDDLEKITDKKSVALNGGKHYVFVKVNKDEYLKALNYFENDDLISGKIF